jgi:hypothetical protein
VREPRGGADERARGRYPVASVRPLVLLRVRQAGSRAVGHLTVAALYVEAGGVYYGLPDVDPWDEARDARRYPGPWPVVAHPPCNRWSIMVESNPQIRDLLGQDGGTFAAALDAVRTYGGVLEHPALTRAWAGGLRRSLIQATPPKLTKDATGIQRASSPGSTARALTRRRLGGATAANASGTREIWEAAAHGRGRL